MAGYGCCPPRCLVGVTCSNWWQQLAAACGDTSAVQLIGRHSVRLLAGGKWQLGSWGTATASDDCCAASGRRRLPVGEQGFLRNSGWRQQQPHSFVTGLHAGWWTGYFWQCRTICTDSNLKNRLEITSNPKSPGLNYSIPGCIDFKSWQD